MIRKIENDDLENCASLFARTFSNKPWNEPWDNSSAYKRLKHFFDSEGFVGVLVEDNNLLGFALGNVEPFCGGDIFYLREMCTEVESQSRGIGSKVLSFLEKSLISADVKRIYLMTEHEIPASRFYKNKGFKVNKTTGCFTKAIGS